MLGEQSRHLLAGLPLPKTGGTLVDVGGGHAQTAPVLARIGWHCTVTGSDPICAARLPDGLAFEVADNLALPHPDRSFDAAISFRLLPHCDHWRELIGELCRVARHRVVVDYPTRQSLNVVSDAFFALKKGVEKNTRPFTLFSHREIRGAFAAHGFRVVQRTPQFFWPMVVHRMLERPAASKILEAPCRLIGLTAAFGSPVVLVAERAEKTT